MHAISAPAIPSSGGSRMGFSSWNDGGLQSHSITVPAWPTTLTVNFIRQAACSANPPTAGSASVSPFSSDGYYDVGTSVLA